MGTIRRAERRDIPRLLTLLEQVNMVHHRARPDLFNGPATKYNRAELEEMLEEEQRPIFAWTDENDVLQGYAFCIHQQHVHDPILTDIRTLYIDDLCVEESFRGQHVGRELYEYVLAYARSCGCYNVTLNVWVGNDSAMGFYERCGLKPQKIGMETILSSSGPILPEG